MIFGYPWFKKFKPDIDWEKSKLKGPKVKIETLLYSTLQCAKTWLKQKNQDNEDLILEGGPLNRNHHQAGFFPQHCGKVSTTDTPSPPHCHNNHNL